MNHSSSSKIISIVHFLLKNTHLTIVLINFIISPSYDLQELSATYPGSTLVQLAFHVTYFLFLSSFFSDIDSSSRMTTTTTYVPGKQ